MTHRADERLYIGERVGHPPYGLGSECVLVVEVGGERRRLAAGHLNWGYRGAGPTNLARAILTDYFGVAALPPGLDPAAFSAELLAALPQDREFRLPARAVADWVQRQRQR